MHPRITSIGNRTPLTPSISFKPFQSNRSVWTSGKLGRQCDRTKFLIYRFVALDDPRGISEALRGSSLGDYWEYRVGDYLVIASIDDSVVRILVIRIENRKEVYR